MLMVTLSAITRNAIMLNVITQNAIMLNFTAHKQLPPSPKQQYKMFLFFQSMSTLHVWYTKLKWSMDVLLRFYERHAFICALHKETKLLFDELLYCLQRLYSINCQVTQAPIGGEGGRSMDHY
jgi:hypothetical protein